MTKFIWTVSIVCCIWLFLQFAIFFAKKSCEARWKDSGIESKYEVIGNCRIKIKGNWIPENNYKEIES